MTGPDPTPVSPPVELTSPRRCPHCRAEVTKVIQHRTHHGRAWLELRPCEHATMQMDFLTTP
jgi:hypothetical protein